MSRTWKACWFVWSLFSLHNTRLFRIETSSPLSCLIHIIDANQSNIRFSLPPSASTLREFSHNIYYTLIRNHISDLVAAHNLCSPTSIHHCTALRHESALHGVYLEMTIRSDLAPIIDFCTWLWIRCMWRSIRLMILQKSNYM